MVGAVGESRANDSSSIPALVPMMRSGFRALMRSYSNPSSVERTPAWLHPARPGPTGGQRPSWRADSGLDFDDVIRDSRPEERWPAWAG